jgi:hypothetical protein
MRHWSFVMLRNSPTMSGIGPYSTRDIGKEMRS